MATWHRVQLRKHEILVVEAGNFKITIRGSGEARIEPADHGEQPEWRKPPRSELVRIDRAATPEDPAEE